MIRFEHANSLKYSGIQTSGFVKVEDNNPFLEPVHGISLRDYTAMCLKISAGIDYQEVCKAMGLESVIWEELNTIWPQRMGEGTSFTVTTLFGQYYAENVTLPQLENLKAEISEDGLANLERIKTDRYFYEELAGARQAAYEYGIDGAQWILDNFGINLADFQSVAMQWMTEQNQNWNSQDIMEFSNYQQEKQKNMPLNLPQNKAEMLQMISTFSTSFLIHQIRFVKTDRIFCLRINFIAQNELTPN